MAARLPASSVAAIVGLLLRRPDIQAVCRERPQPVCSSHFLIDATGGSFRSARVGFAQLRFRPPACYRSGLIPAIALPLRSTTGALLGDPGATASENPST